MLIARVSSLRFACFYGDEALEGLFTTIAALASSGLIPILALAEGDLISILMGIPSSFTSSQNWTSYDTDEQTSRAETVMDEPARRVFHRFKHGESVQKYRGEFGFIFITLLRIKMLKYVVNLFVT